MALEEIVGRTTSRAMSNSLLSSYSFCFVFTKHPVQLKTATANDMFSKYVLFVKGHLNKRAGVWTPPGSATEMSVTCARCEAIQVRGVRTSFPAVGTPDCTPADTLERPAFPLRALPGQSLQAPHRPAQTLLGRAWTQSAGDTSTPWWN